MPLIAFLSIYPKEYLKNIGLGRLFLTFLDQKKEFRTNFNYDSKEINEGTFGRSYLNSIRKSSKLFRVISIFLFIFAFLNFFLIYLYFDYKINFLKVMSNEFFLINSLFIKQNFLILLLFSDQI